MEEEEEEMEKEENKNKLEKKIKHQMGLSSDVSQFWLKATGDVF